MKELDFNDESDITEVVEDYSYYFTDEEGFTGIDLIDYMSMSAEEELGDDVFNDPEEGDGHDWDLIFDDEW